MENINYPNKLYVSEYNCENHLIGKSHFSVVVVASDSKTAREHIKERLGFDVEPTWLMNAVYPTLYTSDGSKPLQIQVKILSNNSFHTY